MGETIQYLSWKKLLKGSITEVIASLALCAFLLSEPILYALGVILPNALTRLNLDKIIFTAILAFLLVIYYTASRRIGKKKTAIWPIYLLVFSVISISVLAYPEYNEWFAHSYYGIINSFLYLQCGIYALLFFSLIEDRERLMGTVIFSEKINLLYYIVLYVFAMRRGYWGGVNGNGEFVMLSYNLTFGYNVARVCIVGMLMYLYDKKKNQGAIIAAISFAMVVLAGSRGALICIAAAVVFIVWMRLKSRRGGKKFLAIAILLFALLVVLFLGLDRIMDLLIAILSRLNISSRSIKMLIRGSMMEGNGRASIWGISQDMIRNGGLFGYGFYGDRYVIGQRWSYGYPHNIFYELAIEFGPVIAVLVLFVVLKDAISMLLHCEDSNLRFLLILYFSCSFKLIVSDSFWYNYPFWAMISVICIWKQQNKRFGVIRLRRV